MTAGPAFLSHPCFWGVPLHLGFAVADLDVAMQRMSSLLGHTWRPVVRGAGGHFITGATKQDWDVDVVKSLTGEPGIELLRGHPGSTWHTDKTIVLHHYAYASDDVDRDVAVMRTAGWGVEVTRPETGSFAYLVQDGQPRVELCTPDTAG